MTLELMITIMVYSNQQYYLCKHISTIRANRCEARTSDRVFRVLGTALHRSSV